jgi:predicted Zn-dependent protease
LESVGARSFPYEALPPADPSAAGSLFEKTREDLAEAWPVRNERVLSAAEAFEEGRVSDAQEAAAAILATEPTNADALNLMAQIAHHLGRGDEAEGLLARCVEASPDHQPYRHNYAVLLSLTDKLDEAEAQTLSLLEKDPRNPLFLNLYGQVLSKQRRFADAIACYRGLAMDHPESPELWARLGSTLRSVGGHTEEAIAAFRRAVQIAPSLGSMWWALGSMKTFAFSQADIDAMEAELARAPASPQHRADMHYALGKAYGDLGIYEKSFQHYTRGNAIRRIDLRYDPDDTTDMVSRARAIFTSGLFEKNSAAGHASTEPIFVLGLQRAGSTLVEQILSSHSLIEAAGELRCLLRVVGEEVMPKTGPDYPNGIENLSADDLRNLGAKYLELARTHLVQNKPYFVDKCPYNLWQVGMIHLILPNAKIIDIRRHPIGCCLANFTMSFAFAPPLSYRLTDMGRFYRDYVRLMAHFDRVLPGKIHRVIYEELVGDLEGEVRRLFDFLGLPFEPACLEYYKNDRAFNSFSNEQVRRPIFTEAVERWRNYEPWLGPLKASLGSVLDAYPGVPEFNDDTTLNAARSL